MRETTSISYNLKSTDMDFTVDLVFDKEDFSLLSPSGGTSEWTKLGFHKCSHCPLNKKEVPYCPLASAIDSVITELHNFLSYDKVDAQVEQKNRVISAHITMQRALRSLMGLIIPTSGFPHTAYFRPMSRSHLPFADTEETIYRATTMFLLAQYFIHKKSGCIPTDFGRLETIYNNVHIVNTQICKRLREFCENDSPLNAIMNCDANKECPAKNRPQTPCWELAKEQSDYRYILQICLDCIVHILKGDNSVLSKDDRQSIMVNKANCVLRSEDCRIII